MVSHRGGQQGENGDFVDDGCCICPSHTIGFEFRCKLEGISGRGKTFLNELQKPVHEMYRLQKKKAPGKGSFGLCFDL
jgi:hypothetical protein